ncbi:MAG TPA: helix-turn-helix transcriptional regulator [Solirubrobacterales bacterium]
MATWLLGWIERRPALDDRQRAWLIEQLEAENSDQIEDIRETGRMPNDFGAHELIVTRAVIRWLRDGDDPGPAASFFIEKYVRLYGPRQTDSDRAAQEAWAAALVDLRDGDMVPSEEPVPIDDPENRRRILDFQGRKVRELMEGRGLTIGELADLSGVDIVELVAILSGMTEMALGDWELISAALQVDLDAAFAGIRFIPAARPDGRGIVVIEGEDEPTGIGGSPAAGEEGP